MMGIRAIMAWSGGKDSAMALAALRTQGVAVTALLTTVTEDYERVTIHGVRRALLAAQGAALGLPLIEVPLPPRCSNEEYERRMTAALAGARRQGVEALAFGDLFLADIRAYWERLLERVGMQPLFPLWGQEAGEYARHVVAAGVRAVVVCVDSRRLGPEWLGHPYDEELLAALPAGVDPCGENGEFHTFVYDGPGFRHPVPFRPGERVLREGCWYLDLLPG
ncbi:MAG: diphthine--ammonia ligase [Bacillota bacterium]|nr:MAG: diphthine--ammonia ligase [Bacillota bacterium]